MRMDLYGLDGRKHTIIHPVGQIPPIVVRNGVPVPGDPEKYGALVLPTYPKKGKDHA